MRLLIHNAYVLCEFESSTKAKEILIDMIGKGELNAINVLLNLKNQLQNLIHKC